MESAFGQRSLDLHTIGVDIFDDAIAEPSAKTIGHNLNSPRAGQEPHALGVPIHARVGTLRASRVRARSGHICADIARERIAIDRLWQQQRRDRRHDATHESYCAEIGPAQGALCKIKDVSTRACRAAPGISAMGLELHVGDHMQGDNG